VVHIIGTTFTKCIAPSGSDSIGGGLCVREGQLLVSNSTFTQCIARFGGALALLDSCMVVQGATFTDCAAASEGGVLLTWHHTIPTWAPDAAAHLVEAMFVRCLCREVTGSVSIKGYRDAVIDHCNFTGCRAGSSGGAVSCLASNVLVFRTHFVRMPAAGTAKTCQRESPARSLTDLGMRRATLTRSRAETRCGLLEPPQQTMRCSCSGRRSRASSGTRP
jgi:hypothetical protein